MPGMFPVSLRDLTSPFDFVFLMFASSEFIKEEFSSLSYSITQDNYLNKSDTDVELDILLIASPIRAEIGKTSIFLTFLILS